MPRGDKSSYTDKQKRQARDIEQGYERKGVPTKESERRAWATVNKISGGGKKSGSGRKESAVKKAGAKKMPAKRQPATSKAAKPRRASAPTRGVKAKKSTKTKSASADARKSAGTNIARKQVAGKRRIAAVKSQPAKSGAAKPLRTKKAKRRLSPQAKKNLATKHLWALVEKKKRHTAQTPAWQTIVHHDHPAPAPVNATAPIDVHGHRDRGGG